MENHLNPSDPKSYALRGLVPRVLEYLYASIGRQVESGGGKVSYACRCSFYEIFNEKVFDLVDDSNRDNPMGLTVREDTRKGVYVEGLMEEQVRRVFDCACVCVCARRAITVVIEFIVSCFVVYSSTSSCLLLVCIIYCMCT